MEEKLKKVPKLRFKDENGEEFPEWEVSAIKKIAKVYDGTHQTPQYCAEGIKFVSVEDIYNLYKSKKFISKEKYNKEFKIKPSFRDVFMTRIGDIGRVSIIRVKEPLAFYVSLALFKFSRESINSTFAFFYMQNSLFQSELWKRTLHIAFPKKINLGEIADCVINLPTLPEQTRIADFFTKLDSYIEQQKLEVEKLKEQKKGFMQKIFSQEIRFKDENGEEFPEWEEKKLGEVIEKYKEFSSKNGIYEHVSLTKDGVVPKSKRYDRDFLVKQADKKYRVTHLNDICYNPANLKFGVICRNKYGDGIFSPIYVTYHTKEGTDPCFIEALVTRDSFIKNAIRYQEGTVYERMAVSPDDFVLMEIQIPTLPEQTRIADFFTKLDEQIEVEKAILEKWKLLKKGFLQQMFI